MNRAFSGRPALSSDQYGVLLEMVRNALGPSIYYSKSKSQLVRFRSDHFCTEYDSTQFVPVSGSLGTRKFISLRAVLFV